MQKHSCTSQSNNKTMIHRGVHLVWAILHLFLFFFICFYNLCSSTMHVRAYTNLHIPYTCTLYIQNIKSHSVMISHARYRRRLLWFHFGGRFDIMLITSRLFFILHRQYTKTCVWIPSSPFCDNWLESCYPLYFAKELYV